MQIIYKEIINHIFDNKDIPYYSIERRIDAIFSLFIEDILSAKYKNPVIFVTSEFPLKIESSNQSKELDYLCKQANDNIIYFIEFKTDARSYKESQLSFYLENSNWNDLIDSLKKKILDGNIDSLIRIKYFYLIKRLYQNKLISLDNVEIFGEIEPLINSTIKKDMNNRTRLINKVVSSIESQNINTKIVYIGPDNEKFSKILETNNVDFLTFQKIKELYITTKYQAEYEYLMKKLILG